MERVIPIVDSPNGFSDAEIADFVAFVQAGGEVDVKGLENRVCEAEKLIFVRVGECLAGVGALKNPVASYRSETAKKAKVNLAYAHYPLELGWVFVLPSLERKKIGTTIVQELVACAGGKGIFATSNTENTKMHKLLIGAGFTTIGTPFASKRRRLKIQLFVKCATV